MINTTTGDVRMVDFDAGLIAGSTAMPMPGPDEAVVYGTEDQIQRLSKAIKALDADEKRKAKRKAQKAARKANR